MERGETATKHEDNTLTSDNRVYVPARVSFPNGRPNIKSAKGVILVDGWYLLFICLLIQIRLFLYYRLAVVVSQDTKRQCNRFIYTNRGKRNIAKCLCCFVCPLRFFEPLYRGHMHWK